MENGEPLDPMTERVVSELAAKLLPELRRAVSEEGAGLAARTEAERLSQLIKERAVEEAQGRLDLASSLMAAFEEISALRDLCGKSANAQGMVYEALTHIEEALHVKGASSNQIQKRIQDGVEEGRAGRQELIRQLQAAVEEERAGRQSILQMFQMLRKDLSSFQGSVQGAVQNALKAHTIPGPSGPPASLEVSGQALERIVEAVTGELSGKLAEKSSDGDTAGLLEEIAGKVDALGKGPQLLEEAIPNWEGLLRAHVQAQSRELDTLSQELSSLQRQSEAVLTQALKEAARLEIAEWNEAWEKRANRAEAEQKKLVRALWTLAGIGLLSLLFSIAGLLR